MLMLFFAGELRVFGSSIEKRNWPPSSLVYMAALGWGGEAL